MQTTRISTAELSKYIAAWHNCRKENNPFEGYWHESIEAICANLPSGSGIDNGMKFNFEKSGENKLVFDFSFHHMNENGYYDGWTEHVLTVTPHFSYGFDLKISGRDKNEVKDYLYQLFQEVFTTSND